VQKKKKVICVVLGSKLVYFLEAKHFTGSEAVICPSKNLNSFHTEKGHPHMMQ
jgi:hypothetical protein